MISNKPTSKTQITVDINEFDKFASSVPQFRVMIIKATKKNNRQTPIKILQKTLTFILTSLLFFLHYILPPHTL